MGKKTRSPDHVPVFPPVVTLTNGDLMAALSGLNDIRMALVAGAGLSHDAASSRLRAAVWDAACTTARRHPMPPVQYDQTTRNFAALVRVHGEAATSCVADALIRAFRP